MKIERKQTFSSILAVMAVLLMVSGTYHIGSYLFSDDSVQAYTSVHNSTSPANAPDSYIVTIPDVNFKAALNAAIAIKTSTVRTATQNITFGDMKTLNGLVPATSFNAKNITSLEGAQFLQTATILYFNDNQITDISPLAGLTNAQRFYLRNNQITDLAPLANLTKLQRIDLNRNQNLTSISHLQNLSNLVEVNVGVTRVADLSPLVGKNQLQYVHVDAMQGGVRPDLTPISNLPALLSVNAGHTRYTHNELAVLKDASALTRLNISGNNVYDLQAVLGEGFGLLQAQYSTFTDERHTVSTIAKVLLNPLKDLDGNTVPVTENANVINVDASGNPSQNGGYLLLVNAAGAGSTTVNWSKDFTLPSFNGATKPFSGTLTINYDLDEQAPEFSPAQPAKIITRKGSPINLDDVTATDDGVGIDANGMSHDAAAIGLDVNNPAPAIYTVTYEVSDKNQNTATVTREIEVTDADVLQSLVDSVTGDLLTGKTPASISVVELAKAHAEAIIANNAAPQNTIDAALQDLQRAIDGLVTLPSAPTNSTTPTNSTNIDASTETVIRKPSDSLADSGVSIFLVIGAAVLSLGAGGFLLARKKRK